MVLLLLLGYDTHQRYPQSKDLLGWEYLSGANPGYGGGNHIANSADTWYPTWSSDGNLYTPWTDGSVHVS